jgi:hypothetical protein
MTALALETAQRPRSALGQDRRPAPRSATRDAPPLDTRDPGWWLIRGAPPRVAVAAASRPLLAKGKGGYLGGSPPAISRSTRATKTIRRQPIRRRGRSRVDADLLAQVGENRRPGPPLQHLSRTDGFWKGPGARSRRPDDIVRSTLIRALEHVKDFEPERGAFPPTFVDSLPHDIDGEAGDETRPVRSARISRTMTSRRSERSDRDAPCLRSGARAAGGSAAGCRRGASGVRIQLGLARSSGQSANAKNARQRHVGWRNDAGAPRMRECRKRQNHVRPSARHSAKVSSPGHPDGTSVD